MGRQRGGATARAVKRSSGRVRYHRVTAAGSSALVTLVAVMGGIGLLPVTGSEAASQTMTKTGDVSLDGINLSASVRASLPLHPENRPGPAASEIAESAASAEAATSRALPSSSGSGKRVVFDISEQRVWLVSRRDKVQRTYLVSGSLTDNLDAGSYEVYSKSLDAIGIDDSGTMRYMVRFAHGERAAIGFHDIPVLDGEKVQTLDELGTPQSHGCIRQRRVDAKALWDFAPVGTTVVVLA
jgi:hypothetical protein